jgi:hypothetical protein
MTDSEELPSMPADLLAQGKSLMKAGTPFVTAISVQKPRDLDKVVAAIDREAEYAGDSFWYGWVDKKGNRIEGPSIGLANSLAREWTNCAVTCALEENEEAFYITSRFIDLEKGSQMERIFRQRKNSVAGNFDPDRKLDMALQIGSSKAIRNVVCNSVPRWLVERAIEKAKLAVQKKIDPKKLDEHKANALAFFKKYGVTQEQLVFKAGKPMAEWTTREIADFQADAKALQNGEASVADLFPSPETKAPEGPITGKAVADAIMPDKPAEAAPEAGPSAEEQERIRLREIASTKAMQCSWCGGLYGADTVEEMDAHIEKDHPGKPTSGRPKPTPSTQKAPAAPSKAPPAKPGGPGLFGS